MATNSFFFGQTPSPEANVVDALIDSLEIKIQSVDQSTAAIEAASASAASSASNAAISEANVAGLAVQAQTALAQANVAIVEANSTLNEANTAAASAISSASASASSATEAASSATSASVSAGTATTQAASATTNASNAATSATSASSSASTATTQASAASSSASAAATSATESATSASLAEDWATKTSGTVDGTNYSSKYWATQENVGTVATNISNINSVGSNIANVNTVAGNSTNINTVATNNTNISTVAGISSNVTTVATNNTNVSTVATNIASVNTNATNIAAIQGASANATAAASSATAASSSASTATTQATNAATSATNAATSASQAAISASSAAAIVTGVASNRPSIRPSLLLDFANTKTLDPRITFARASTGTYYDGKTVAKAEENLLLYSQEFNNAAWGKTGTTITVDTNTAPDGTSTAETIAETLTTGTHNLAEAFVPTNGLSYVFSVFVKKGTGPAARDFVQLGLPNTTFGVNSYANFDINSGTVAVTGAGLTSASIVSVGNSWYRCTIVDTAVASAASVAVISLISTSTAVNQESYLGIANADMFIWGAQIEQRSSVTAYTPTTTQPITNYIPTLLTAAAGVPRFEHNPITGESLGLEVEEQRTNLLLRSEEFENAYWVKARATVSPNVLVAPDGTQSADKLVEDTTTSNSHFVEKSYSTTSGTVYTYSMFAKAGERSKVQLQFFTNTNHICLFDLVAGTVTSNALATGTISPIGNGWYRCSMTFTAGLTGLSFFDIHLYTTGLNYTGDGYSGFYLWGAQLEAGAFPTSYIPTVASQVTRSADAASMTGMNFSSWYRADEGTVYVEGQVETNRNYSGSFRHFVHLTTTSNSDSGVNILINGSNVPQSQIRTAQVNQSDLTSGLNTGALLKLVSAYKTNDFGFSANGATAATDTSGLPALSPALEQMTIGRVRDGNSGGQLNGTIKRLCYYPKRLTNPELQGITS